MNMSFVSNKCEKN